MWTRAELKSNAKAVLQNSYWESVVAVLVVGAISIGASLIAYFVPFGGALTTIFLMLPLGVELNFFFIQNQIAPSRMQNIFHVFKSGGYMCITSFIPSFMTDSFMTNGLMPNWPMDLPMNLPVIDSSWIPALIASVVINIAGLIIAYIKALSYSMTSYILTVNPFIGSDRAL